MSSSPDLKKIGELAKQIRILQTWVRYGSAAGLVIAGGSMISNRGLSKTQAQMLAGGIILGNVGYATYLSYSIGAAGGQVSIADILTGFPTPAN